MRIDEITINIPITIDLDGDKPKVDVAGKDALPQDSVAMTTVKPKPKTPKVNNVDDDELDQNPVMVSPLQQDLELKKAELGKNSPVIDKMLDDDAKGNEESTDQDDNIENLKTLAGLNK